MDNLSNSNHINDTNIFLKFVEFVLKFINPAITRFIIARDNKSYFSYDNQQCQYYYPKSMGNVEYVCLVNNSIDDSHNEKIRSISNDVHVVIVSGGFTTLSKEQAGIISDMKNLEVIYMMGQGKHSHFYFYKTKPKWFNDYSTEGIVYELSEFTNIASKFSQP